MSPRAKAPRPSEHSIQAAFIEWVRMNQGRHPDLATGHSIPNGAALARAKGADGKWSSGFKQAAKLRREGLVPGILDWHLPCRGGRVVGPSGLVGRYIGLWLEFKRPGEHMSEAQLLIAGLLLDQGHRVEEVDSHAKAINIVEEYLGVPAEERTQTFE